MLRLKFIVRLLLAAACACIAASTMASAASTTHQNPDPWEAGNRVVFGIYRVLDDVTLKPVSKLYREITSPYIRQRVTRFYANVGELRNGVNGLLQGNEVLARDALVRLVVNSTVGIGGLYDVAGNYIGIEEHEETFADTLQAWNVPVGPYIVVPVIGPSTVRNLPAVAIDILMNPLMLLDSDILHMSLFAGRAVEHRESVLTQEAIIRELDPDPYNALKVFYLNNLDSDLNSLDSEGKDNIYSYEAFSGELDEVSLR